MIKDFNIYEIFPTEDSYKTFLYNLKFKNLLICPYCYSNITTNTIMHKTRLDYRKWLLALYLFLFKENISYRYLSSILNVNKNTAYNMIKKLNYLYINFKIEIMSLITSNSSNEEILSNILLIKIK